MTRWRLALVAMVVLALPARLDAQGYSLRLDSRMQRVQFRGVSEDSVPIAETVSAANGSLTTADGYAVTCDPAGTCHFYRPGPVITAAPFSQQASFTAWGLGVQGLSVHVDGRMLTDLAAADAWPGTEPTVQLMEGYAEYARTALSARLGRQTITSRLGFTGFDGARVVGRWLSTGLEADVYGGYGLARATALPITSPALNPLDEYRPSRRTILAGAAISYSGAAGEARAEYLREVDPRSDYFVSERAALSMDRGFGRHVSFSGGGEYDLAEGRWGSADAQLRVLSNVVSGAVSVRHYRPHFDLWTIWGAFSPVPYNAVSAAVWVHPRAGVELRGRAERYWFEATEAGSPLVNPEDAGWRASIGTTVRLAPSWSADLDAHREFGPGAASRGIDGGLTWSPLTSLDVRASGAALERPLEFRYDDASVSTLGLDVDWRMTERWRASAGVARYWETRDRPDAAAFDWAQTRMRAGLTLLFGGATATPLPPARRRTPRTTGATP